MKHFQTLAGVAVACATVAAALSSPASAQSLSQMTTGCREDRQPCQAAREFAGKAGGPVKILPVPLSHLEINSKLGLPGDYTAKVDAFLNDLQIR